MDEIANYNIERWKALTKANAVFTRPYLTLDASSAREKVDPEGRLGEIRGKDILCLAGGGGQQSVAFALLGATVTVVDLSEEQLQRDRDAAAHYHASLKTLQADMRDLSRLGAKTFDIVWQPYSLNFVPDARVVFGHVARVLRADGLYHFNCANPFVSGLGEQDWNGEGYTLKYPYQDGFGATLRIGKVGRWRHFAGRFGRRSALRRKTPFPFKEIGMRYRRKSKTAAQWGRRFERRKQFYQRSGK